MEEIKNVREINKNISDEDRRKNAEAIMLKLAKIMNFDDYGDENGYGEEEETN
jgi:hypothetical protein